jgi:hypothetical protein
LISFLFILSFLCFEAR